MISSINDELPAPPGLAQSSQPSNSPETTVSTGRTFPTGVGAPALLEDLQDDREGTTLLVIHRFQALLPALLGDAQHASTSPVIFSIAVAETDVRPDPSRCVMPCVSASPLRTADALSGRRVHSGVFRGPSERATCRAGVSAVPAPRFWVSV